jgi:hypothetical protein
MAGGSVRQVDARRWQNGILRLLEAFPDQYAALEYLNVTAGETHRAARLIHDTAPRFLERYVEWIEPYLPGAG